MFGLKTNNAVDAAAVATLFDSRRVAANKKVDAITKQVVEGITPAIPVRQRALFATNGSMSRWGTGSHTVPNCSNPGVRESKRVERDLGATLHRSSRGSNPSGRSRKGLRGRRKQ
jgi:hypothetical protein